MSIANSNIVLELILSTIILLPLSLYMVKVGKRQKITGKEEGPFGDKYTLKILSKRDPEGIEDYKKVLFSDERKERNKKRAGAIIGFGYLYLGLYLLQWIAFFFAIFFEN